MKFSLNNKAKLFKLKLLVNELSSKRVLKYIVIVVEEIIWKEVTKSRVKHHDLKFGESVGKGPKISADFRKEYLGLNKFERKYKSNLESFIRGRWWADCQVRINTKAK